VCFELEIRNQAQENDDDDDDDDDDLVRHGV
jgi:hypothetical protein